MFSQQHWVLCIFSLLAKEGAKIRIRLTSSKHLAENVSQLPVRCGLSGAYLTTTVFSNVCIW